MLDRAVGIRLVPEEGDSWKFSFDLLFAILIVLLGLVLDLVSENNNT